MDAFTIGAAILGLAAVYVLLPVVASAYRRLRGVRTVTCPRTQASTEIELDATHGALTAAVGPTELRVSRCGEWPAHRDCGEQCLVQIDPAAPVRQAG